MTEEKTKPEIIRSVADGDKAVLNYPDDTIEELRKRYQAFFARASEINRSDGWQHYRISIVAELRQLIIIAERRQEDAGDTNET